MNCNSSMRYYQGTANNNLDNTYVQTNDFGQQVVETPTEMPTSPFSVQPNGPGTPTTIDPGYNRPTLPSVTTPSPLPETLTQYIYTPGYLNDHIGALMRVEFLIANNLNDRVGILKEVGASYIVLESLDQGSVVMCDLYSIKFVTILQSNTDRRLLGAF